MSARLEACPTTTVEAPADRAWALLTHPQGWAFFFDVHNVVVQPPGPLRIGQRIRAQSRVVLLRLTLEIRVVAVDALRHELRLLVDLPLGLRVDEDVTVRPLGERACQVSYSCGFRLPSGWRGWLLRTALKHELEEGPVDSLMRLKRAAEVPTTEAGAPQRADRWMKANPDGVPMLEMKMQRRLLLLAALPGIPSQRVPRRAIPALPFGLPACAPRQAAMVEFGMAWAFTRDSPPMSPTSGRPPARGLASIRTTARSLGTGGRAPSAPIVDGNSATPAGSAYRSGAGG